MIVKICDLCGKEILKGEEEKNFVIKRKWPMVLWENNEVTLEVHSECFQSFVNTLSNKNVKALYEAQNARERN